MDLPILFLVFGVILMPFILFLPIRFKPLFSFALTVYFTFLTSIWAIKAFQMGFYQLKITNLPIIGLIEFKIDLLSAFFILMINLISLCTAFYAIAYLKKYTNSLSLNLHFIAFNILQLSMLQVCMLHNLLAFLIVWEIMTVSATFLVIFESEKAEARNAVINVSGSLFFF